MGAITSDFPSLPQDADPRRVYEYTQAYKSLTEQGLALPAQSVATVTRAQLLAHLQALAGTVIRAELDSDPEARGYSGDTNAQAAARIVAPFAPVAIRRFPRTSQTGYELIAGSTTGALVATVVGGAAALFTTSLVDEGIVSTDAIIRFRANTTTVGLRGRMFRLVDVLAADTLAQAPLLPVLPAVGDVFDIVQTRLAQLPPRLGQFLRIPYAPNVLTAADIAGART